MWETLLYGWVSFEAEPREQGVEKTRAPRFDFLHACYGISAKMIGSCSMFNFLTGQIGDTFVTGCCTFVIFTQGL